MERQVNEKIKMKIYDTIKKHEAIQDELSKNHPGEFYKATMMRLCDSLKELGERDKAQKEKQAIIEAAPAELKKINQLKTPRARMKKKDELIGKLLQA